jgi:hypothetical protein
MKILEMEQGTQEWLEARLGCPSGSGFSKLITASGTPSSSAESYINDLIAELITGESTPFHVTEWMQRGTELEPFARMNYELETDSEVTEVGFCMHDTLRCGVSPDGLIGDDGGIEIKCPKPSTHVKYLRKGTLPSEYKAQVMGCLWITGRQWWDFMSYHPQMPNLLIRVHRDDEYINQLERLVTHACQIIEKEVAEIKEKLL